MILNPMQTTVAYRCPHCGGCVTSPVGAFSLAGDMFRLKCPCGESELIITFEGDKVRLNVPCIVCPAPHNYVISKSVFYGRELFELVCTYSSIGICFIGEAEKVKEAYDESTKSLAELVGVDPDDIDYSDNSGDTSDLEPKSGEEADEDEDDKANPAHNPDAFLHTVIGYLLRELYDEHRIKCLCQKNESQDIDFEFIQGGIRVFCASCGASKFVPLTGLSASTEFLNCDMLTLDE